MQIAIVADQHFGARNDSVPLQTAIGKFIDTIFLPTLEARHITHILNAGDVLDRRKYTNHGTLHFVHTRYREPLRRRGVIEHVCLGNHDLFLRDSNRVSAIVELSRHDETLRVYATPETIDIDGFQVLMVPWIISETEADTYTALKTSNAQMVIAHVPLRGFQEYRGQVCTEGLPPDVFSRFRRVLAGHFHHKSTIDNITYVGAFGHYIWSDYADERGFHIYDTDTDTLEFIENPYSLFVKLIYDDDGQSVAYSHQLLQQILAADSPYREAYVKLIVKSRTQPYWYDSVVDALYKVGVQDIVVVDDIVVADETANATILPTTTDVDTLNLMQEYVTDLSISADKDALMSYLRDKYEEALSVSQSARLS